MNNLLPKHFFKLVNFCLNISCLNIFLFFILNINNLHAQPEISTPFQNLQNLKEFYGFADITDPKDVQVFRLGFNETENETEDSLLLTKIAQFENLEILFISTYTLEEVLPYIKKLKKLIAIEYSTSSAVYMPKELCELTQLTHLSCMGNELIALPTEIKNLKNLQYLSCPNNELTALPKEIGELKNLIYLNLNYNEITALPEEIGLLHKLKYIDFLHNKLKVLPKSVGNLKNLNFVNFADNQLNALPNEVGNWTNVETAYFNMNKLETLPNEIGNWTKLKDFNVQDNKINALPASIGNLENLENLDVYQNKLKSLPKEIGNLTKLYTLLLNQNQLETLPEEINNLTSLKYLTVSGNKLKNLPKNLEKLKNLQTLSCDNNELKNIFDELMQNDNFTLEALNCDNNKIEQISPNIKFLKGLKTLQIGNNNLIELPKEITTLQNLIHLECDFNKIMTLPEDIGNLEKLINLFLSKNCLIKLPNSIKALKNLTSLNISYNNFSEVQTEVLDLVELYQFNAAFNKIKIIPQNIQKLNKAYDINFSNNDITVINENAVYLKNVTFNLDSNKISKLPVFFENNKNNISNYRFKLAGNNFTVMPHLKKFYDFDLRQHLVTFFKNPIKTLQNKTQKQDNFLQNKKIVRLDWIKMLDFDRGEKLYQYEDMEMMRPLPDPKKSKKIAKIPPYNNPNGKKLYAEFRKNYASFRQNMDLEIGFSTKLNVYERTLLNMINLIRIDLYGASWHIQNKEYAPAKAILQALSAQFKNFEIIVDKKSQKIDIKSLKQAKYDYEDLEAEKAINTQKANTTIPNELPKKTFATWKTKLLEVDFLAKKYETVCKSIIKNKKNSYDPEPEIIYPIGYEKPQPEETKEEQTQYNSNMTATEIYEMEKEKATSDLIVRFFLEMLPVFEEDFADLNMLLDKKITESHKNLSQKDKENAEKMLLKNTEKYLKTLKVKA